MSPLFVDRVGGRGAKVLGTVAVAVALSAACGGAGSDPPIPAAPTSTTTKQARFPVGVQRMGGVAGFDDRVSVQADGSVLARTKRGQVSCTLDPAALATLNDAALEIGDTDQPGAPSTPPADGMVVLVSAGTGLADLADPRLAGARDTVNQLLADVTGRPAERKICH